DSFEPVIESIKQPSFWGASDSNGHGGFLRKMYIIAKIPRSLLHPSEQASRCVEEL
ncbi:hypothetical protein MAE30S32_49490, partial [Microcystis aeruginosa 11-30S32]